MSVWVVYRKGSFYIKERIGSEALYEQRKNALEEGGATHVRMVREDDDSLWLKCAVELNRRPIMRDRA